MRRVAVGTLVAALFAAPVFASVALLDTDGDNMVSFEEMSAVYEDFTEEDFAEIDTGGDGLIDETELAAAIEAEMIEAPGE